MPFTPYSTPVTLHHYASRLVAIEHPTAEPHPKSYILFIGGLGDGIRTVNYPLPLSKKLLLSHAVVELNLSCAYSGWTTSTLARDADDLGKAVSYFRALGAERIILMGHSTGCQIAMHYLVGAWRSAPTPEPTPARPAVDGLILQAGISDREGLADALTPAETESSLELARAWVQQGRGDDVLPNDATHLACGASPTARRWLSLASARDDEADDDYFSSDLGDARVERIWGAGGLAGRGTPVLVLLSGADEHMPAAVDKAALTERWGGFVKRGGGQWSEFSGPVPGAHHNLNRSSSEAVDGLLERVAKFIEGLDAKREGQKL